MGLARDVMRTLTILLMMEAAGFAEPAPPCVPTGDIKQVELEADRVKFCIDDACYFAGLADGHYSKAPAAADKAESTAQITETATEVKVCKPDGSACRTLRPKLANPNKSPLLAEANAGGTIAAVWLGGGDPTKVETYDLTTGKRLATFKAGTNDTPLVQIAFVGDTLLVTEGSMAGPDTFVARLVTKTGKRLGALGGKKHPIIAFKLDPIHVKDALWAFNASDGSSVVIQSIAKGTIDRTIAVGAPAEFGLAVPMVGDAAHLALVFGGNRSGEVAVIDLATANVSHYKPTTCR